jgi:hypothetical protein
MVMGHFLRTLETEVDGYHLNLTRLSPSAAASGVVVAADSALVVAEAFAIAEVFYDIISKRELILGRLSTYTLRLLFCMAFRAMSFEPIFIPFC